MSKTLYSEKTLVKKNDKNQYFDVFRFRRFLRSCALVRNLKILFEYNVPPLIICVKTYTLRKKLLLFYQK